MTNKRQKTVIFRSLLLVLILVAVYIVYHLTQPNYYRISPENSKLFGISDPKEFCETKGANSCFAGKYTYARVDGQGDLILVMSDRQITAVKNDIYALEVLQAVLGSKRSIGVSVGWSNDPLGFLKDAPNCGLEISDDFTAIVEGPGDLPWYYMYVVPACAMMQILDGVPSDQVKVEYIVVNEYGEETKEIGWPPYEEGF